MVKVSIRFGGSSTNRGTVDILRPEFVFFEMVGENAQFDGIACLSEGEKQHLRVINVLQYIDLSGIFHILQDFETTWHICPPRLVEHTLVCSKIA